MPSGGPRRVAIIGTSTYWGAELARRLERDRSVEYVAGIDTEPPPIDLEHTELLEADIRNPVIAKVLPATRADTVVHCGILWHPAPGKPAGAVHDINVVGTLQLLAACERVEGLERVILRGSSAIYGTAGAAPQFFAESMAGRFPLRTRFQRDAAELEGYFENFARRHPDLICCMLRFQPEIGPDIDTPLARFLSLPVVPVQLGFDPRLQLLHSDDAAGALLAAVRNPARGPVNVAPDGSISLSRALRLLRRPALPIAHPLYGPLLGRLAERLGLGELQADAVGMLRHGRGLDNGRLRGEVGFVPAFDAAGVIRDLATRGRGRSIVPVPHPGSMLGALVGGGRS